MVNTRSIEIDFDIHKLIETERQNFEESPNDVLRRLLNLPASKLEKSVTISKHTDQLNWRDKDTVLPHGTEIQMTYNGRTWHGKIIGGKWIIGNQQFESPSGAASGIALTKEGKTTRLDGWKYWDVKLPGEVSWKRLESLRTSNMTLKDLDL